MADAPEAERIPDGDRQQSLQSLERGMAVIQVFSRQRPALTLSEVANLTGLRPSLGRVPTTGVVPLAWTLDTVGPMGRSAAECRMVLEGLCAAKAAERADDAEIEVLTTRGGKLRRAVADGPPASTPT